MTPEDRRALRGWANDLERWALSLQGVAGPLAERSAKQAAERVTLLRRIAAEGEGAELSVTVKPKPWHLDRADLWARFAAEGPSPAVLSALNVERFDALVAEFVTDSDGRREVVAIYAESPAGDLGWQAVIVQPAAGRRPIGVTSSGWAEVHPNPFAAFRRALVRWFADRESAPE